ncbi:hypothetical protein E2C01_099228 [Portunus trituberculatus]|uniref:Uncharacterized protein n=1 Tax=Portunus trituberculatus TaxID=210409 RepID=A0A5B7KAF4_PORTR|nr:hypothetical protein [Portunus trituberculatus]
MTATANEAGSGGGGFLRTRLRSALHTSNDLLSGLSSNISRLSVFSVASGNSNASSERSPPPHAPANPPEKPPSTPPLQLPPSPEESHRSPTMKEMIKVGRLCSICFAHAGNVLFLHFLFICLLLLLLLLLFYYLFIFFFALPPFIARSEQKK